MAVIEDLGLSVAVRIDGVAAVEYEDPEPVPDKEYPDTKVVSKYIESTDDTEYEIHSRILPQHRWLSEGNERVLSFHTYTDGIFRDGKVGYKRDQTTGRDIVSCGTIIMPLEGVSCILRKFRFGAVTTVDAADVETIKKDAEAAVCLGTIRVLVWRCLLQGAGSPPVEDGEQARLSVAEKALKGKAVSHGTSLSAPEETSNTGWVTTEKLYGRPFAIFLFKYRSKDSLRKEMIVPRTPSPGPVPEGVDGLSHAELQRLAAERLAQMKTEKKSVMKRESDVMYDLTGDDDDDDGPPRPVKMPRKRKESETIDLTAD